MNILHIEPKYVSNEGTPLKWYHFLTKFSLILGALVNTGNVIMSFTQDYILIVRFMSVALLVLNLVALIQLNQRLWSGVLALMGMWGLNIFLNVYLIARGMYYGLDSNTVDYMQLGTNTVSMLILMWLNWIYFCKRRLLFQPLPEMDEQNFSTSGASDRMTSKMTEDKL